MKTEPILHELLECAPDVLLIVGHDGRIVLANAQAEKLFGHHRRELLDQHVEILVPARFRGRHTALRSVYVTEPTVRAMGPALDLYGLHADGTEFPVEISLSPLTTEDGVFIVAAILDITDRRRTEVALREREAQLRGLVDNLPYGTVVYQVVRRPDGSNYFPYMSRGQEQAAGIPASQALTDPAAIYGLFTEQDQQRIRTAGDESMRTMEPFEVELPFRTTSGEERWLQVRGQPRRLADGSTLWDAMALDVTDRRRLTEALAASEARYRRLTEESAEGIIIHQAGVIRLANRAAARMLGYEGAMDAIGQGLAPHIAPEDRERVLARIAARLHGEPVPSTNELEVLRRDGGRVVIEATATVIEWEGAPATRVAILDISERRRREVAEREAANLRSVAMLANAAAHELNNPLTLATGSLQFLQAEIGDHPTAHIYVERARRAVQRITEMIGRMQSITRLEPLHGLHTAGVPTLDLRRSSAPTPGGGPISNEGGSEPPLTS